VLDDFDEFVFPEPWWDLRGHDHREAHRREALVARLLVELGGKHELAGRSIEAVAAFTRQDEILYRIDGGSAFLFAHLTYTNSPPDPFIGLRLFTSWDDTAAMVHKMAEEW